jgi:hypothetical protein
MYRCSEPLACFSRCWQSSSMTRQFLSDSRRIVQLRIRDFLLAPARYL